MSTAQKLTHLRRVMKDHQLDAYIVPSSDPHQSEYSAEHWNSRAWLSGFTGSAAVVVVTQDWAGLWTDSRYFIQAEEQLAGSEIELMRANEDLSYEEWLIEHLMPHSRVGIDAQLFSVTQKRNLTEELDAGHIQLISQDLIAAIWKERPALSKSKIAIHDLAYAGKSSLEKIAEVRAEMQSQQLDVFLVSMLDEIAWLFNLRGADVAFNPVFYAFASITLDEVYLFADQEKIEETVMAHLQANQIKTLPYRAFEFYIGDLPKEQNIGLDVNTFSANLQEYLKGESVEVKSPIQTLKAVKNETEIEHLQGIMEKDGVALLRAFRWLEKTLKERSLSEVELGEQLSKFRSQQIHYQGDSFHPVVGFRGNGAIVHYRAQPENCAQIQGEGILLVDSGGQYLDGTTDITRTIALGKPTAEQKRHFTLVLKGHIALASIRFPEGTTGTQLDILARQFLWQHHLNYGHGTGHGVGFFLNVHESPPSISPSINRITTLEAGMVFSNEPGFYKTGEYGIRIENLLLCVEDKSTEDFGDFLKFETLSLFPIDYALIDTSLMTAKEMAWLNRYHHEVYKRLSPHLEEEERKWLELKCRKI
ncbi:MAG: aminopeptidase P family protein [Bacteroidota bacterium]